MSGYKCSFESKISVGTMSTLLRENIACGNKILACNLTKEKIYNFPIKGICSINNCNYLSFEKRLINILKIKKYSVFI